MSWLCDIGGTEILKQIPALLSCLAVLSCHPALSSCLVLLPSRPALSFCIVWDFNPASIVKFTTMALLCSVRGSMHTSWISRSRRSWWRSFQWSRNTSAASAHNRFCSTSRTWWCPSCARRIRRNRSSRGSSVDSWPPFSRTRWQSSRVASEHLSDLFGVVSWLVSLHWGMVCSDKLRWLPVRRLVGACVRSFVAVSSPVL